MNDTDNLKAAAEACKDLLPLRYMHSPGGSLSIRNDHGIVFGVHQNRSFPSMMEANKAHADLVLAATPEAILALIAENDALRKDAKRYRWLREQEAERGVCIINVGEWTAGATCIATTFHSAEFADEMVDAAMAKELTP